MQKTQDELMRKEKGFWEALDNPDFYTKNMAQDALAVINGEVKTHDDAVAMTREMPMKWDNISFKNERFVQLSDDTAAVVYEASANQKGGQNYAATITSVYTKRDGQFALVLTTHAQPTDTGTKTKQKEPDAAASA